MKITHIIQCLEALKKINGEEAELTNIEINVGENKMEITSWYDRKLPTELVVKKGQVYINDDSRY